MPGTTISTFLSALTSGDLEVIDLTTPLSAATPALRLPDPFGHWQEAA